MLPRRDLIGCLRTVPLTLLLVCMTSLSIAGYRDRLYWPSYLGESGEKGVACLSGPTELQHEIEDRLGKAHVYTTACQITELLFILLAQNGGNGDPLGVLDLTRQGGPIKLIQGLPWVERILKDKSGTLHIVVGAAVLRLGLYGSIVQIYSTKTWEGLTLARAEGKQNQQSGFWECSEKGDDGYETTKQIVEEKHRYEDQNGDGFEDIVVETVETSCATYKSKISNKVFLATDHGFKEAAPPSKKSKVRPRRS